MVSIFESRSLVERSFHHCARRVNRSRTTESLLMIRGKAFHVMFILRESTRSCLDTLIRGNGGNHLRGGIVLSSFCHSNNVITSIDWITGCNALYLSEIMRKRTA